MRVRLALGTAVSALLLLIVCGLVTAPGAAADEPPVQVSGSNSVFLVRAEQPVGDGSGMSSPPCAGCLHLMTPVCLVDRFGNAPPPGQPCIEIVDWCPPGRVGRQDWTSDGRGGWVPGPRRCYRDDPGVSLAGVTSDLVGRLSHRVPMQRPARQPVGRALVRLPVVFASGQNPGPRTWNDHVAGFAVTITVEPRWHWAFGDGAELTTTEPGSRWPDTSVAHAYRRPGRFTAVLTTTWDGTFWVAGAGTFPIAGAVRQQAALRVPVRPARAVLVP